MLEIWCVEDDESIREIEMYTLQTMNFKTRSFENGTSFFKALKEKKPDLVILDLMLPDEDGSDILRRIRGNSATKELPVIIASAKTAEYDKVKNLDSGADDYLTKPFGMMEMVSRVKAVLRRTQRREEKDRIERDGVKILLKRHEVFVNGEEIELTLKEYGLLKLLITHPETVFSREEIMDQIWETGFYGETRTVDVHVRTLRQKLSEAGKHIETVRGVGYRYHEGN
ncbi:winged helix-turn-helix domain-containing protein [Lactobacillus amylovorus]|mgnify:FL=1|uniref:Response regulator transcription factor n=1 Tax=Lactobacillus amylovorus TaxID=1604 RepID=A0A9X3W7N1_LACAM|nr:response regulator transcription factor [Lactobacillus amylovorus]MDD6864738.1 response regulator transcription factor [Lactobacillus sp.]MDB6234592.1 response regulator transcription factor [Lactobacillus amylovorus]MDB6243655.1 response regulator transcription factor [Lactobacillus amylovorus]MDB6249532.1 response regulator transcription factor [Lactobacillus amylovorus]MDB6251837.1 response regulator transcription factor [Lactobacillus amylovorus]